ncbi:hypothetical protein CEXT_586281 [Caerostris extrusa]|uniref:Uncharacterized protein n=1 Tax=Caerostris extrusa TaxID=172846 RepID=A0AAV4W927_CAEEX|nr:hypothetical protein CEXT_586281 [Caerostris extrusa]
MIGQYFKKRRQQVEMIFLIGYGFGLASMPLVFSYWIRIVGWRRGLQILAGLQSVVSFVAVLYRPSLTISSSKTSYFTHQESPEEDRGSQLLESLRLLFYAAFIISGWLVAYPTLTGFGGYVLFVWVYGIFYGGYIYTLKLCVFEKVRARNYARAWSFLLWTQAVPTFIGLPIISDHLNEILDFKRGYYMASGMVFIGTLCLFLIDIHKQRLQKKKKPDLQQRAELIFGKPISRRASSHETIFEGATPKNYGDLRKAQELTCISEEILVENFLEDYIDDCITSCNKEEKFLMLSEFENNLFKTDESSERERPSSSQDDTENAVNTPQHHCNICSCGHRHTDQLVYSPRKVMRAISNIEVIDEATSSL